MSKTVVRLGVGELRHELAGTLHRVELGERVLIERHGAPIAALIPVADYFGLAREGSVHSEAKRIIFTNISGGEGKSFFTFHTAFALADMGLRVAVVDGDPQASLTKRLGLHDDPQSAAHLASSTILAAFACESGEAVLPEPMQVGNLAVWPANRFLSEADGKISSDLSRVGNLREALIRRAGDFDYVLLDSKPGVSPLLSAVTAAAQHLIVPVSAAKGLENLDELGRLVRLARQFSPEVGVRLFVPNRTRSTNLSRGVQEQLRLYSTIAPLAPAVREATVGGEAESARIGVTRYAPKSVLAGDIRVLVSALLEAVGTRVDQEVAR